MFGPSRPDASVAAFAARERIALPEACESLIRRADGIEVGRLFVLGTRDAYRLDMPGPARLVIAPPTEDGALTIVESGEVVWVELGDETTDGRVVAPAAAGGQGSAPIASPGSPVDAWRDPPCRRTRVARHLRAIRGPPWPIRTATCGPSLTALASP
jgi:hypothetical protein